MSLSKSGIDYLDAVWQPIVGCNNNCSWCYGRNRWAPRMRHLCKLCADYVPHMHPERFCDTTPQQSPKVIGLGFFTDLFGPWDLLCPSGHIVPAQTMIEELSLRIAGTPQHQYVTLTKFPENIPPGFDWPDNWWIGVSCTTQEEVDVRVPKLLKSGVPHPILSLEPLLAAINVRKFLPEENPQPDDYESQTEFLRRIQQEDEGKIQWVIIGGLTGCGPSPTQTKWVRRVWQDCDIARVPLFVKRNAPLPPARGESLELIAGELLWPRQAPAPIAAILQEHGIEAETI